MNVYQLAITDVTRYGELYCVAGWDLQRGRMVRPEPPGANAGYEPSRFWRGEYAGPGKVFDVGNVVTLASALSPPADFPLPHRREDRIVQWGSNLNLDFYLDTPDLINAVAGSVSANVRLAFDGGLVKAWNGAGSTKAFVKLGHDGRSLGALETTPDKVHFKESSYDPAKLQLRALVRDGITTYDLSVTSEELKRIWKSEGISAVRDKIAQGDRLHIRLGLSRPFPARPNECYAQVNGIFAY